MYQRVLYVLFMLIGGFLQQNESAKILAIFPFPGPSQFIVVQPYLKALSSRGHELTVISYFPQKQKLPNFRDIVLQDLPIKYGNAINNLLREHSVWEELHWITHVATAATANALQHPEVRELLHSNATFDLVIVETLQQEALYAFGHHFQAPIVGLNSYGTDTQIDELVGNISPAAFIPSVMLSFKDRMNFWQRLQNLVTVTLERIYMRLVYIPLQIEIYQKYFPNPTADLYAVRKNFSLMLVNQHFSLSFPRPYVPNMIDVGGFHLPQKPTKLPADMEAFINGASEGVIYFSLGSNVKSSFLSQEKLDILMGVFRSLKQRVLWKFENTELPGKPHNVFISKWLPQSDILAHPNVKLFITHGGLLSSIEAVYYGKPVLGMPIYFDQHANTERAKNAGYGLKVNFRSFTEEELRVAIMQLLNNPEYAKVAQAMSRRLHDQPLKPLDKAVYWTEYVLRHEGASHMRMAAQDLNFLQMNSLDTMAVLIGGLIVVLWLCIWLLLKVVRCIFGKRVSKNLKQKKE